MAMPDSEAKKKWIAENSVIYTVKLMRKTDQDVIDFLDGKNKRNTICAAIREYMKNHKEEK